MYILSLALEASCLAQFYENLKSRLLPFTRPYWRLWTKSQWDCHRLPTFNKGTCWPPGGRRKPRTEWKLLILTKQPVHHLRLRERERESWELGDVQLRRPRSSCLHPPSFEPKILYWVVPSFDPSLLHCNALRSVWGLDLPSFRETVEVY